ncbi:MAG: di-trans,poly-cis-decaprenylcistransferase, partial [Deltaproteobacteria bacterium]|nr:di-trans,poly-cis-decaprenylcistransferase [Deltaproteobacteria bacterium]
WAQNLNLPRIDGHKKGIDAVEEITMAARDLGVCYLTLYAFSDENWDRPAEEVVALMDLLVKFLKLKKQKLINNGIRFQTIGDNDRLPKYVQEAIAEEEEATRQCDKMTLIVALSYGARTEICRAVEKIIKQGLKEISPEIFSSFLDTYGIPDPDLLIRTSGELRVSNFLLWQIAYSEFYFLDKLWPDFGKADLLKAIEDYRKRERRFGKTREQL